MSNEATNSHNSFFPSLPPPLENTGLLVNGQRLQGRQMGVDVQLNNLLVQQAFLYLLVGLDKNGTLLRCHHSSGKKEEGEKQQQLLREALHISRSSSSDGFGFPG